MRGVQTQQACDACRTRKVRCEVNTRPSTLPTGIDNAVNSTIGGERREPCLSRGASLPCRRCAKIGIECCYRLPVGRRGPKGPRTRSGPGSEQADRSPLMGPMHHAIQIAEQTRSVVAEASHTQVSYPSPVATASISQDTHAQSLLNAVESPAASQTFTNHHASGKPCTQIQCSPSLTAPFNDQVPTDGLCSRELLCQIMDDFLRFLYPIIPILHCPTFFKHLEERRDCHDPNFFGLLLALSAVTVSILSDKFKEYQYAASPIRFSTRLEMTDHCYSLTIQSRGPRYFDEVSHMKWAIAHLFYLAYMHIGQVNKSRMIESEAILFARLLELHRVSTYSGLSCIEAQLRKKAFWLMFCSYVHLNLQSLRKERPGFIDCSILHELDCESLLPVPQDDQYISESSYGTWDAEVPTLTTAFNWRSRVFWCSVAALQPKRPPYRKEVHCHCTRLLDPSSYLQHLHSRYQELKCVLDGAPSYLREWVSRFGTDKGHKNLAAGELGERYGFKPQFDGLHVDIHITTLWLQSLILDQINTFSLTSGSPFARTVTPGFALDSRRQNTIHVDASTMWELKADICRQLLHILYSMPMTSLEANGINVVFKIRDVAVCLLAYPYDVAEQEDSPSGRASMVREYLRDFTYMLRKLDKSERISSVGLQTWVDTDRNQDGEYHYW